MLMQTEKTRSVRSCSLRRRRFLGKSGAGRYWGGNRRFRGRQDQNCQMDRPPRQQCGRVCCFARGSAMCFDSKSKDASRLFRFRGCGQTNEGRVRLSQPAPLFPELDLPQVVPLLRFLHIPRLPRTQCRGQPSGQLRRHQEAFITLRICRIDLRIREYIISQIRQWKV